jgi:UDP-N-acetylglucosamine 2-epimerase (non-hydrolysing)
MPVSSLICVVGARPNFMKMAPIYRELTRRRDRFSPILVHTGQHYDKAMSRVFFDELGMPRPDIDLNVGSGSHASQTAAIMSAFEPVLLDRSPTLAIVVGDVNSTIACALVAVKLGVAVAHVEAGLRSFDRTMPEEINRVLTDQISDLLFTTEASAEANLQREGIAAEKIHFVGNVMIDTLLEHRERARTLNAPARYGLDGRFGLVTLHRPANVDDPATLEDLLTALRAIGEEMPLVFPVHPRTRPGIARSPIAHSMMDAGRLRVVDPLPYLEFVSLMQAAAVVVTDSGGIQEETTILGVPCLTLRNNTERPITVTSGTNVLAGTTSAGIVRAWTEMRERKNPACAPPLWDGHAAERIVDVIESTFQRKP